MTRRLLVAQPFDLALTLEMGQTFRLAASRRRGRFRAALGRPAGAMAHRPRLVLGGVGFVSRSHPTEGWRD